MKKPYATKQAFKWCIETEGPYIALYTNLYPFIFTLGDGGTNIDVWFWTKALNSSLIILRHVESLDSCVKHVAPTKAVEPLILC